MAKRKIHETRLGNRRVTCYFDPALSEYSARLYIGGRLYVPADYFTDDKADCLYTAAEMVKPPEPAESETVTVCAYSRTSAAEVVALVQWAKAMLENEAQGDWPFDIKVYHLTLLATAKTLLWEDD